MSERKLVYGTVWVVVCIEDDGSEVHHIFSHPDKAFEYVDQDAARNHVVYDYLLDDPERHEAYVQ